MDTSTEVKWNPYTSGYFDNPYSHLKECRETNPIQKLKNLDNAYIFLRYADVNSILSDKEHSVTNLSGFFQEKEPYIFRNTSACPYLSSGTKMWTMYLNGAEHKNARGIIGKSLKLSNLQFALDDAVKCVNKKYSNQNEFDLVTYCGEFIYMVVKELLGLTSKADYLLIKEYANHLGKSQDLYVPRQVYQKINDWFLWGKNIFSDSEFQKKLITHSSETGLAYNEDEIYSIAALTLMASFETSKDNLSVTLFELLRNDEMLKYCLACDQQQLNFFIEELFRYSSPQQYTIRVNTEALQFESVLIPPNSKLYLCLASANRDEAKFHSADSIVPDRYPNDHLAFGKGLHFCLGATIARQELRQCLKQFVLFLKDYELQDNSISWHKQIFMRTADSCMVKRKI